MSLPHHFSRLQPMKGLCSPLNPLQRHTLTEAGAVEGCRGLLMADVKPLQVSRSKKILRITTALAAKLDLCGQPSLISLLVTTSGGLPCVLVPPAPRQPSGLQPTAQGGSPLNVSFLPQTPLGLSSRFIAAVVEGLDPAHTVRVAQTA